MDLLCLLATAALIQADQPNSQASVPLTPEIVAQVAPISLPSDHQRGFTEDLKTPITDTPTAETDSDVDAEIQPSPTAVLEGKGILGVSGLWGGNLNESAVFQAIELLLNVSFTGTDRLQVGIESGNGAEFSSNELTFEGRLSFPIETDSSHFELSELSYEFPIGDRASVYISASGSDLSDFNPFLGNSSDGAISEFGTENPINHLVNDVGLQLNYNLTDELSVSLGYFSDPAAGEAGLFAGNQSAFVQLGFEPNDRLLLGFTYIHTDSDFSLETKTGSLRSQINLERPVVGNSYGISASFTPSSQFAIGGWIGLTQATVIHLGNADVWNYALTLTFPNLGREDGLLGVVIGQEPRLASTSGFTIDQRSSDPGISLHIEVFYRYPLSDHILVTPGLIWITAPNHDPSNPDILVVTVRTTFEF